MGRVLTEAQKELSRIRNRRWNERHPDRNKNYYHTHKDYMNAQVKAWREKNPDKLRAQRLRPRLQVLELLGNKCSKCGETDFRVLQIDHINGDGAQDRRENGNQRWAFYKRLLTDPDIHSKYQILCANDNWRKRWDNEEATGRRKLDA